ncbi:MAG: Crp/Fnr family transcriptional regulator [Deltaproteobacteria bacterium]|nr:Crp/Fnr family transcriptional regulator [Deltaproteobacteria bacterium]MBW2393134.1 Crp/Fnr family transcriptional regulator [Deltaproteobacteria bacterium]
MGHLESGRVDANRNSELENAEFFRALGPERRSSVSHMVLEKTLRRGRILFLEGNPADYLWVVKQGEVRLYKASPNGRLMTLEILRPGEMFGAVSALDQDCYTASAEVVNDGIAWIIPRRVMLKLVAEVPTAAIEILVVASRRLHDAHERLRSVAHDPARARLAQALLRASQGGKAEVTRRALAEAAGTTVETAIRVVRRFEREGVIAGEVGRVTIIDVDTLKDIASNSSA